MRRPHLHRIAFIPVLVVALALCGAARAQAPHGPIRGTIEAMDGDALKIATADGKHLVVHVASDARVTGIVTASLADIKPNSYVGMVSRVGADGARMAVEVHIFPEALRGANEGEQPWDMGSTSRMTNGAIALQVGDVEGHVMTVKYAGGESKILVPPNTPIVAYVPGDRAELRPGTKLFIARPTAGPDGGLEAHVVSVGRDGLTPPM